MTNEGDQLPVKVPENCHRLRRYLQYRKPPPLFTARHLEMNRIWTGTALGLFFASTGALLADDPPKKHDPPAKKDEAAKTPAERFAAAKKARVEADQAFQKVIAEIQKKGERPSLENKELNEAFQARNKAMQAVINAAEALA